MLTKYGIIALMLHSHILIILITVISK